MGDELLIARVPRRRPAVTLVDAALDPLGEDAAQQELAPDRAWQSGIEWRPELCGGAWGAIDVQNDCAPPDWTTYTDPVMIAQDTTWAGLDGTPDDRPTYWPVRIHVDDACTWLASRELTYYTDRVEQALALATPKLVGMEFADGVVSQAQGSASPNLWLSKAGVAQDITPAGGAVSIERGYMALERFLTDCGFGQAGMLHVTRDAIPAWGVRRPPGSQLLLTHLDTVVVPDPGYSGKGPGGSAPAAGEAWIYATGMVELRMDAVQSTADGIPIAEVSEVRQNRVEVQAYRYIAPTPPADCCVGAIRVLLDS